MDNSEIKSVLYTLIENTDDLNLLEEVKLMLSGQNLTQDFWEDLPESQRKSIERGIEQAAKGETVAHEDVMKKYGKWLTK
jgi:predicted transcriptional regulator